MKEKTKRVVAVIAVVLMLLVAFSAGYYVAKYYGPTSPKASEFSNYEGLEERASVAKVHARRRNLNEDYCLFVDYAIPSGTPRLFVWSFKENKVVASSYVMHGPGMGSTAEKPVFSNRPGSNCSALGRFEVTKHHGSKLKRSFRLQGLDRDNKTAFARGLMIHCSTWVDANCWRKYIPLHAMSCKGCVTVSSQGMNYLERLITSEEKNLLLWSFCSSQD